jgi:hypothetical protein
MSSMSITNVDDSIYVEPSNVDSRDVKPSNVDSRKAGSRKINFIIFIQFN